jgi:hypothetical protein
VLIWCEQAVKNKGSAEMTTAVPMAGRAILLLNRDPTDRDVM